MNKNIKYLALAAVLMSGLGFSQAQAASVAINANRGGVSVVVSDNKGMAKGGKQKKVVHDIRDRRHLDNCRMCRDARREADRREAARRDAERKKISRKEMIRREASLLRDLRQARRR